MNELQITYKTIDNLEKEELTKLIDYINKKLLNGNANPQKSVGYLKELSDISEIDSITDPVEWQKEQRVETDDFN